MRKSFDVVVIGAGPGGYVAAERAARLGLKVAVVERGDLGGVCLNVGCVPSKALISGAHTWHKLQHDVKAQGIAVKGSLDMKKMNTWKNGVCQRMRKGVGFLMRSAGVEVLKGEAIFVGERSLEVSGVGVVEAEHFVVATGSAPVDLGGAVPGLGFDGERVLSSTEVLSLESLPKKLLVVGGGYIGLEIAGYMARFGVEVELFEQSGALLSGFAEPDCVRLIEKHLKLSGVKLHFGAKVVGAKRTKSGVVLSVEGAAKKAFEARGDCVLVSVGRKPNTAGLGLEGVGVELDGGGFIKTDEQRRTSVRHVFAIGDVAGGDLLAHKASYEGVLVADVLGGAEHRVFDARVVPAVVFTVPELAQVGLSSEQCRHEGRDFLEAKWNFAANAKAVAALEPEGFVKILGDRATHRVLGVHICGMEASSLIGEAALAIEMGARVEDMAYTIHPHPTLSEMLSDCAEKWLQSCS